VQFVVDGSKSAAWIANSAAAIGQPPKRGYSRMAQPCVGTPTCASASPARSCAVPAATSRANRALVGRLAPQMNWSSLSSTGPLPAGSRRSLPRTVSVHGGEFGDACEEWEGAPMTGLPGTIVFVPGRPGCRPVSAPCSNFATGRPTAGRGVPAQRATRRAVSRRPSRDDGVISPALGLCPVAPGPPRHYIAAGKPASWSGLLLVGWF
jgi:hypothetical protein